MLHFIDPTIDYVFKRLLASLGHEDMLIDFLNSLLNPPNRITSVEVLNPFNEKEYSGDKLSIVDIKVKDSLGAIYQIEIQLTTPHYLTKRMLFTWSEIYTRQMGEGDDFDKLKPTIAIWLLTNTLFKQNDNYHHYFQLWDRRNELLFSDQCAIHVFELNKWRKSSELQCQDNWLYFFKEAKHWKTLPKELKKLPTMRQAMATLRDISDQKADYYQYCKRQDSIRVHISDMAEKKRTEEEKIKAETARNKAQADAKKAHADAKKAHADAKKAQADAKKAHADAKKAQADTKKAQATLAEQAKQTIAAEAKAEKAQAALAEQTIATEVKLAKLMDQLRQAGINPDIN